MSVNSQRIYATGGRGRLASLIADHFRAPTHEVALFSRADHEFQSLRSLLDNDVLSGANTLLHLAWSSLPATSEQTPGIENENDLPYLRGLLTSMAALPPEKRPHLVFFSSGGAVYGNAINQPNKESDDCHPIGSYGHAKLAAEQLINEFSNRYGLNCTNLRISNPYGYPVPKKRVQGLIPHALRCAAEEEPLTLWGDGSAQKDFLYYTDFLSGLEQVISHQLTGTVNLCAGESHSVNEIIGMVEKHTEKSISLTRKPAPVWDVQDSRLDSNHLSTSTGWSPQVALDEGIRRSAVSYALH